MTIYKGFSTVDRYKKFRLTDLDSVKRDLLNHFSIRKGEKLMQPEFGSIIWNMLYEPLTPEVQAILSADVKRIIEYDPRLRIDDVLVNELESGIQIQIDLTFLPGDYTDRLVINFDSASKNLTLAS